MSAGPMIPAEVARLYPFSPHRFVTPGGAGLSYLDEGSRSDEAVLMLHGNPTWSFYYRDLVRDLAPRMRCVVPDHVGMGLSDKPAGYDYRLATRIRDDEALVGELGLKRLHLVVHDWGGAIGFGLAIRRPETIGRIVILNTAAFPSSHIPLRIAACRLPGLGEVLVRSLNGFAGPATVMAMSARRLTPAERRGYLFPYDSWDHRIAIDRFIQDIPLEATHPSRATLEEIAAGLGRFAAHPKLLVWGGRDFCFDDRFYSRWREIYPGIRTIRCDGAGHYVLEDAVASVRHQIADFLTNTLPNTPK